MIYEHTRSHGNLSLALYLSIHAQLNFWITVSVVMQWPAIILPKAAVPEQNLDEI